MGGCALARKGPGCSLRPPCFWGLWLWLSCGFTRKTHIRSSFFQSHRWELNPHVPTGAGPLIPTPSGKIVLMPASTKLGLGELNASTLNGSTLALLTNCEPSGVSSFSLCFALRTRGPESTMHLSRSPNTWEAASGPVDHWKGFLPHASSAPYLAVLIAGLPLVSLVSRSSLCRSSEAKLCPH